MFSILIVEDDICACKELTDYFSKIDDTCIIGCRNNKHLKTAIFIDVGDVVEATHIAFIKNNNRFNTLILRNSQHTVNNQRVWRGCYIG